MGLGWLGLILAILLIWIEREETMEAKQIINELGLDINEEFMTKNILPNKILMGREVLFTMLDEGHVKQTYNGYFEFRGFPVELDESINTFKLIYK